MFDLSKLLRSNIRNLSPYSSARDEFTGQEGVFLDANENPITSLASKNYNRYPDPHQRILKQKISPIKDVAVENIFLGNGSDEPIDLLIRAFCEPKQDEILLLPPTYGMYKVCASIQDVAIKTVALDSDFDIRQDAVLDNITEKTKIIFICTPNNPTANAVSYDKIKTILKAFDGIVVVDEAYIDFSEKESFTNYLDEYPNLVVLHTFSKAWGMAALRLGMCFASEEIIQVLTKIKFPYNINQATIDLAMLALDKHDEMKSLVATINSERNRLQEELLKFDFVVFVYPSETNFLLVKVTQPKAIYNYLLNEKVIIRDRSDVIGCEGSLRFSIGTKEENDLVIKLLKDFKA